MSNDRILDKIKKCLALSASDNENEAASALRQAQKLMELHGVTMEALTGADIGEGKAKSTACTKPAGWENALCRLLSRAFGCQPLIHKGWFNKHTNSNGALAEFVYIGLKHQAMTASYAHDVLRRQIIRARAKYLPARDEAYFARWGVKMRLKDKIAAGEAFCLGFVENVSKQVHAITLEPAHEAAIKACYEEARAKGAKATKATQRGHDWTAYEAGKEAGKEAQLHRPMAGAAETLKLN